MTMRPDAVADLFGLPPEAESAQSAAEAEAAAAAAEAAEAALAAEIAATLESGGFAADAPESRTDTRVKVSWPARMQLPDGRVIELKVRDVSQGGVGLVSNVDIPARTVVGFEMGVPQSGEAGKSTPVMGTIKTTYTVAQGSEILAGGTWQAPPAGLDLVTTWIRRLKP